MPSSAPPARPDDWIRRVIKQLALVRAAAPTDAPALGPKMREAQLARLEFALGVTLPLDYRAFLRHIGNGGAGPGSGLQRFGAPDLSPVGDPLGRGVAELAADPERLARPFPLKGGVQFEFPDAEFADDYEGDYEEWARRVFRPALTSGNLLLADYGGVSARLIVAGAAPGYVWAFDEGDGEWIAPFADSGLTHRGVPPEPKAYPFRDWYEHWLDATLAATAPG